ncbi:MAG: universal stress protein [Planctomycetota bacterium]
MSSTKIIVPWDFSDRAYAALMYGLDRYSPEQLRVICVLERPTLYEMGPSWGPESERQSVDRCQKKFFDIVKDLDWTDLQFVARFGDPAEEILRFAEQQEADSILMPTHGRTGIPRLLFGSVASKVAVSATCPIELLPNKWFEESEYGQRAVKESLTKHVKDLQSPSMEQAT